MNCITAFAAHPKQHELHNEIMRVENSFSFLVFTLHLCMLNGTCTICAELINCCLLIELTYICIVDFSLFTFDCDEGILKEHYHPQIQEAARLKGANTFC